MDNTLKSKLSLLTMRMREAKTVKNRLNKIVQSDVPTPQSEEMPDKNKAKRIREKAFINAIANIPSYKSAEYYQLHQIAQKLPILDTKEWREKKLTGVLHQATMKLAVRRMGQVLTRLINDARQERRRR